MKKFALVMALALALTGVEAYADEGINVPVRVVDKYTPGPWLLYQDEASWEFYDRYEASEEPLRMATHFKVVDRYACVWSVFIFEEAISEGGGVNSIRFVNRTLDRCWRLMGNADLSGAFVFYAELDEDMDVLEIAVYSEDGLPMNGELSALITRFYDKQQED